MQIKLRPWHPNDLINLTAYANNPNIAKNMTDRFPYPFTAEHAQKFIEKNSAPSIPNILAIDLNGEAIGGIGLHPQEDIQRMNAELGYWLGEPYWGKGIITEAIKLIVDYGFKNFEINRIFAKPFGTNIASQKALEKAGFILEGRFEKTLFKNGESVDELIYAARRKP
ncbi:MAG: family N-acetyltransferase [Bacteroidetes bacterium]|jgi:RimJ/RimL family protein N-acetyltransferase|nr:family N-acetyltransferase [Bacteroidota bacterium]